MRISWLYPAHLCVLVLAITVVGLSLAAQEPAPAPAVDPAARPGFPGILNTSDDLPECRIVLVDDEPEKFLVFSLATGKAIPEAKTLTVLIETPELPPVALCNIWQGLYAPTECEVRRWRVKTVDVVAAEAFQKLVDAMEDPEPAATAEEPQTLRTGQISNPGGPDPGQVESTTQPPLVPLVPQVPKK